MTETLFSLTDEQAAERDAFVERILQSTAGAFDTFTLFIGQKLGFYRLLAEHGAMTSLELDVDSPNYVLPLTQMIAGAVRPLPQLLNAFRDVEVLPIDNFFFRVYRLGQ